MAIDKATEEVLTSDWERTKTEIRQQYPNLTPEDMQADDVKGMLKNIQATGVKKNAAEATLKAIVRRRQGETV